MLGFNADLAPVADVWSNPDNTVIGDRAYSDDFAQAAELIPEAVRGFHSGGVATTLKHFPGHGDALADSHDGAVYVSKPLEQLRREELLPFRAGIASGRAGAVRSVRLGNPFVFRIAVITPIGDFQIGIKLLYILFPKQIVINANRKSPALHVPGDGVYVSGSRSDSRRIYFLISFTE